LTQLIFNQVSNIGICIAQIASFSAAVSDVYLVALTGEVYASVDNIFTNTRIDTCGVIVIRCSSVLGLCGSERKC